MKTLTIFCSGKTGIKQEYIDVTKKLMESLDRTKFRIAYGGGNVGLMGVVRDSFKGEIITSNIHKFVVPGYPDNYVFDNITERQSKLIEIGDAFLLLPGGFGSIYECLEVITKNQIGEISKPVYIFNYNHVYDNLIKLFEDLIKEGFIKHDLDWYKIRVFSDYEEFVNMNIS